MKKLAHCLYAESARHTGTDWSRNYVSYPEGRVRRLTPLEAERLQGFPDDWTLPKRQIDDVDRLDSARYHACGNAVSVPTVEWIGQRLLSEFGWAASADDAWTDLRVPLNTAKLPMRSCWSSTSTTKKIRSAPMPSS